METENVFGVSAVHFMINLLFDFQTHTRETCMRCNKQNFAYFQKTRIPVTQECLANYVFETCILSNLYSKRTNHTLKTGMFLTGGYRLKFKMYDLNKASIICDFGAMFDII